MNGLLADVVLFGLGLFLGLRVVAASYRVLDLWYTIRTAWQQVMAGLLGWLATAAAVGWLAGPHRIPFLAGLPIFGLLNLSVHHLHRLLRRVGSGIREIDILR